MTLVEVMFVIVLVGLVLNLSTMYFFKGRDTTLKYNKKASQIMSVRTLKDYWRKFVSNNGGVFVVSSDRVVFNNKSMVYLEKDKVVFSSPKGKTTYAVPKDSTVTFSRETGQGESDRLIMLLSRYGKHKKLLTDKSFRLVACISGRQL